MTSIQLISQTTVVQGIEDMAHITGVSIDLRWNRILSMLILKAASPWLQKRPECSDYDNVHAQLPSKPKYRYITTNSSEAAK